MTDLSPAAQAVLDAYWANPGGLVMALRVAADQLTDATSSHMLYAVAAELEGAGARATAQSERSTPVSGHWR